MLTPMTTSLQRLLRAAALAAGLAAATVPAAHAEAVTPQAADANAAFLAYAGAPPVAGKVCVVDTGVDLTTDATASVEARYSIYGGTVGDVGGSNITKHGTYVAGVIASQNDNQATVGIWPRAKIISVRVFPDGNSGSSVPTYLEALDRCRTAGASVINMSLSGLGTATGSQLTQLDNRINDLRVTYAINVVAAAGNTGGEIGYPGRFGAAFTVGASDSTGSLCTFSSRGPQLDISTYGCGVLVSMENGQLGLASGTSYSTPIVSAALAALRAYSPGLTVQAAEDLLVTTARMTPAGKLLDVAAAFRAAGLGAVAATPIPPSPAPSGAPATVTRIVQAPISTDPLAELGVRTPRLRNKSYRRGVLRIAVSGVPDFGRAIFTVDRRRYTRAEGKLSVRLRRAPRRVSIVIDVPEVGRTDALVVRVQAARPPTRTNQRLKRCR